MKKITVCIADMDVGYRASLRKTLESSGSVEVVADAGDGLAALEAVETLHPQVLLTDTLLPGLKTEGAFIPVDRRMATNLPHVYACGDCTGQPLQIAKAVGEGNVAAISASADLSKGVRA